MLRELSIRNFAIIDDLRTRFSEGLTVFSGETGAGKSIIINAVNLLLGGRATTELIRSGADAAELEALFDITPGSDTARLLERYGYATPEGLLVRRIISRKNRHRVYINGRLSTLQILEAITANLASISGQHAHQGLLKENQHLLLLDQYADLMPLRARVHTLFNDMLPLIEERNALRTGRQQQDQRRELLAFQKQEIQAASVSPGEDELLLAEKTRLGNARLLQETVHRCLNTLYDGRGAVVEQTGAAVRDLETASGKDPALSPIAADLAQAAVEIEDAVAALRTYLDGLALDPQRLEWVEERLDLLHKLKRKYGGSLTAVLKHLKTIEAELAGMENSSQRMAQIESRLSELNQNLAEQAGRLSVKRHQAARRLSEHVVQELGELKMAPIVFEVSVQRSAQRADADPYLNVDDATVSDTGIDHAAFLIAPNIGEDLKPLASIASGGELSRVVLALKAIVAKTDAVETVVFDEVDAGIGGGVAELVGRKLAALAEHHQIICITHLPQIARFGDHQFRISKQVEQGRTRTLICPVDDQERIAEIARMLGGETITQTTLDHARELLENR